MLKTDIIALPLLIAGVVLAVTSEYVTAQLLGLGCMFYAVMIVIHGDDAL